MTATLTAIVFFLGLSILFYVLFAGADFGAGILEIFSRRENREAQRRVISHAMAPVWEANHVWLVLAVVILFVGFPTVYTTITTFLYLPVMAVLVGIVLRGTAFTFRYYDVPVSDYERIYTKIFSFSSLWTSFFLGVLAGATFLGRISPDALTFRETYIDPWANTFCVALGLFTCALFATLAAVYLIGEAKDEEVRAIFRRRAAAASAALVFLGPAVFAAADANGLPLASRFFSNYLSLSCFLTATLLLAPFWLSVWAGRNSIVMRGLAVSIITLVLIGWYAVQYPVIVRTSGSPGTLHLTFEEAAAPNATLTSLLGALIAGSLLILPALGYLMRIFKWETIERETR